MVFKPEAKSSRFIPPTHFADSNGNVIELIPGLWDQIKPRWQSIFAPPKRHQRPSRESLHTTIQRQMQLVASINHQLTLNSYSMKDKTILEIGAYDGATAYTLAGAGAAHVKAIDIASYYIHQTPGGVVASHAVQEKNKELSDLRGIFRNFFGSKIVEKVTFHEDDICTSELPSSSVVLIVSVEVLERLTDPYTTFSQMSRILKPGGVAFHKYNPFFSINGGHSACTLDMFWGHARLNDNDFNRYLDEVCPDFKRVATSFFKNNLGRMTFSDLRQLLILIGFEVISFLPWTARKHADYVSPDILKQVTANHPTAELTDLITPSA